VIIEIEKLEPKSTITFFEDFQAIIDAEIMIDIAEEDAPERKFKTICSCGSNKNILKNCVLNCSKSKDSRNFLFSTLFTRNAKKVPNTAEPQRLAEVILPISRLVNPFCLRNKLKITPYIWPAKLVMAVNI